VAPIRHRVNEYKVEIDPGTLGVNGGNIRITRKGAAYRRCCITPT